MQFSCLLAFPRYYCLRVVAFPVASAAPFLPPFYPATDHARIRFVYYMIINELLQL